MQSTRFCLDPEPFLILDLADKLDNDDLLPETPQRKVIVLT
jgi:hypothetical protein